LKLPFFEPTLTAAEPTKSATRIDDEGIIKCRGHDSRFDLMSGEIVS
jgi:nitrite reductase/ring-hydroxylating ferredoxin subunit